MQIFDGHVHAGPDPSNVHRRAYGCAAPDERIEHRVADVGAEFHQARRQFQRERHRVVAIRFRREQPKVLRVAQKFLFRDVRLALSGQRRRLFVRDQNKFQETAVERITGALPRSPRGRVAAKGQVRFGELSVVRLDPRNMFARCEADLD